MVATLFAPSAHAATKMPTPKATTTSTKKATPTKKSTATKKAVVKKKAVKKKPQRKATLSPSPSPKWPPAGFKSNGEVFARIPNAKELIGTASNSKILTRQLARLVDGVRICEKYSCGAVQISSLNGCTWWEITANLVGAKSDEDQTTRIFGTIRTLVRESAPKQITTVLLISQEPLELNHAVTGIVASCHHDATSEKLPSSTYTAITN
jgi:hypothetical protein